MSKRTNGEGSFFERPDGTWQYRVMVNGRRVAASGRTKTEARDRARERARVVGERRTRATVADLVADWSRLDPERVGLRPTTADQYRSLLRAHVVPAIGGIELESLRRRDVADLLDGMGGAASSRRSAYAALVKVLDHAVSSGLLGANVARDVPRPQAPHAIRRGVAPEGARAILGASEGHRWAVAAWLGFGCGLRRGEMVGLRWDDVDLEAAVLAIRRDGNVTRSSAGLASGAPKTRKGERRVPVPAVVVAALRAHRAQQAADRLAAAHWEDSGHVLVNEVGGIIEPRSLSRAWQGWARAAGVADTGTHLGRHFAATELLASGQASVADVAAQLGHDPAVLLTTYAVAVAAGQRAAADALGASLATPTPAAVPIPVPTGRRTGRRGPTPVDANPLGDSDRPTGTDDRGREA